jgi:hypothetical protein
LMTSSGFAKISITTGLPSFCHTLAMLIRLVQKPFTPATRNSAIIVVIFFECCVVTSSSPSKRKITYSNFVRINVFRFCVKTDRSAPFPFSEHSL